MQALILAAGIGTRLNELTKDKTKCMVRVNDKSIIEYTLEQLVANNINRLVIVTGYLSCVLKDFISSKFSESRLGGMQIDYLENPLYESTNNIYSLYLARDELLKSDTVMIESDLLFRPTLLPRLITNSYPNVAVVSPWEDWMDGTVTLVNDKDEITDFIGKKAQHIADRPTYFKTVNIYKFSKEFSRQYYIPFLEAYMSAFGKNVYYEDALKVISILKPDELHALIVPGSDWYEIDNKVDLANAEKHFQ